jgi:hypothetical protein
MVGEENRRWCAPCGVGRAHIGVIAMASLLRRIGFKRHGVALHTDHLRQDLLHQGQAGSRCRSGRGYAKASAPNAAALRQVDMRQRRAFLNKDSFPYQPAELEMRTQHPEVRWIAKGAKVVLEFQYTARGRQRIALGQK